ncbi:unnamed protein product [Penicillium olsonii]|uniref:Amidohydrolase-related domain-containing protein n=1 Tax=Penicillium olsonii TaxID=99116 RepID=A0A9W4IH71_PENOL|nr:unnamed protein product [Penicillium olsonii]CAG8276787.1 unnamed protein product [Penicillium olsonii]
MLSVLEYLPFKRLARRLRLSTDMTTAEMWDTHIHCFDPERYPFKPTRKYTPGPAKLDDLLRSCQSKKVVLVQASIEDGYHGLVAHLQRIHAEYPHLVARGTICMDEDWETLSDQEFDFLHNVGVRSCRVHGILGAHRLSVEDQIRQFARSYPARKFGWSLSAQLPLTVWASLEDVALHDPEISPLAIIADHNGCATPADIGSAELKAFVNMLQSERLYVKISALYRRCPESIEYMQPIIHQFATLAPQSLLWGSDWPHVDTSNRSLQPPDTDKTKAERVDDVPGERLALKSWLTDKQWSAMLIDNPNRVFES